MADKNRGQLSQVHVTPASSEPQSTNLTAPSSTLTPSESAKSVATTSQLIQDFPSVTNRRISGLNVDASVRGYDTAELNATANGMTERRTVQDVDSLFSQIDPGLIENMTVIDGPYSSLYGPGFAFLMGDLTPPPRYPQGPETHLSSVFNYGSNGQSLYTRDNIITGGPDWGMVYSYGLRVANDYRSGGGANSFLVPSSYQTWDSFLSTSFDLGRGARIEFDFLHKEMNNVLLPGVAFDLNFSGNDQFNLRYVIQEDPHGPEQFVLQAWYQNTSWNGDASREEKQDSVLLPVHNASRTTTIRAPVNAIDNGASSSLGLRALRTFGGADTAQWTIGADWRRYTYRYQDEEVDALGNICFGGNIFGVPSSEMDDVGVLTNLTVPVSERLTLTVGGRVDYAQPHVDQNDPVITYIVGSEPVVLLSGHLRDRPRWAWPTPPAN